jgi:hypothetical protein
MVTVVALALAIHASSPVLPTDPKAPPKPKFSIVAASLFKNGYAVVTRALDVRPGTTVISEIPSGALGTVWFQITDGLKIVSVRNTFAPISTSTPRAIGSIPELIQLNLGKTVKLGLEKGSATGKLISINGDMVLIDTAEGVKGLHTSSITSLVGPKTLHKTTRDVDKTKQRVLKITVKGNSPGRLYMIALERGLSWSPAYSLDITDPAKLKFTMKATLLDDLGDFKGIETRLVTGFPNVMYAGTEDPIFAQTSLDQYLASIGASDAQRNALNSNFAFANNMQGQMVAAKALAPGRGGGGFGGGGRPMEADMVAQMTPTSDLQGVQAEDLYFYRLPDVQMDLGDRAYFVLKAGSVPFKEVYTWEGMDPVVNNTSFGNPGNRQPPQDDQPIPVWHSLEFDNKLGLPLTTAPAVTVQGGEILGQDLLKYTSQGAKATVKITKALDVEADSYDEEVSRENEKLRYSNRIAYDLVHLSTTMSFVNHKTKSVHLRITFPYTGEVEDAGGGTEVKGHKSLHDVNPSGKLTWEKDLGAGESLTVTFKSKVFVNPHGY